MGVAVQKSIRKTSQVPVLTLTAVEDEQTQVASFDGQFDKTVFYGYPRQVNNGSAAPEQSGWKGKYMDI